MKNEKVSIVFPEGFNIPDSGEIIIDSFHIKEDIIYEITDNLRVIHYRNGDLIYEARTDEEFKRYGKDKIGCFCRYVKEDDTEKYGFLYNWYAVNDQKGLAPSGYHIPTDKEFDDIEEGFMKTAVLGGWWSATEISAASAWNRDMSFSSSSVGRYLNSKELGFSVLCVKD